MFRPRGISTHYPIPVLISNKFASRIIIKTGNFLIRSSETKLGNRNPKEEKWAALPRRNQTPLSFAAYQIIHAL